MVSRFHDRFGTAGLVVAVIALIVVLGGTAFAASGGLTSKQKKEVKKIAKSFQGKGPTGPQGPAGANGTNGANGKDGAPGAPGTPGAPGAPGKSVVSEEVAPGSDCEAGGYSFEVEGSNEENFVCNGTDGSGGGGSQTVLAPGETETGAWAFSTPPNSMALAAITYPFALPSNPTEPPLLIEPGGESTTECPGSASEPKALPGYVCVYETNTSGLEHNWYNPIATPNGEKTGIVMEFGNTGAASGWGFGSWAATAPSS